MTSRGGSLGYEMQRVIDLGLIDNWLRGLSRIAPRSSDGSDDDFNTHMIAYDSTDLIAPAHILRTHGCHQLLASCSRHNIAVDIEINKTKHLCVIFKPEHPFASSRIFKAAYTNVLPTLFGQPKTRH